MTALVVAPTVNMNGTDGKVLLQRYLDLHGKVCDFIGDMRQAMPHGRDYQLAPETYADARSQHEQMLLHLANMQTNLETIALAIQNQLGK